MCGIAGIFNTHARPIDRQSLQALADRLQHRGPDGYGFHIDGAVGLGHRRLAIIDLETGDQPQSNEDKSIWIVFNGEIYNFLELRQDLLAKGHRFKTNSDTEVIIHAYEQWGADCLRRLRGMFAFAIWDAKRRQIFLARDRVGIKPLCYYQDSRRFAFASEMQSLAFLEEFDSTLDLQALDLYLHLQYIPAPYSIYRQIRKLPPAHYMVVGEHGVVKEPTCYWDIDFTPDYKTPEDEWIERLDEALADAVRYHLVSDVPFGAFLSGGVDSSTVVGYMSRLLDQPVKTFTIGFDDRETDERVFAQQAADALGTDHHLEIVQPEAVDLLPTLVSHYGEPFADSSSICTYLVSQVARKQVKMVLSGDGGDEIFAGYSYYPKMLQNFPAPEGIYRKARRSAGNFARRIGLLSDLPSPERAWYDRSPFFGESQREYLWRPEFRNLPVGSRSWNLTQFAPVRSKDLLSQCQYVDIHNYLPFDNLNKVDIASMAHGLEVRVPLLDHVLLETVCRIPPDLRVRLVNSTDGWGEYAETKYLFKKVGQKFFPPGFFSREKKGFSVPVDRWLKEIDQEVFYDRLCGQPLLGELFSKEFIESLIRNREGDSNFGHRCWSLLFLGEWLQQFPVSIR